MKKKMFWVGMLIFVFTLVFTTSVALAAKPEPVGERIVIQGDPITFPAGEAFHIQHGFGIGFEINEPVGNSVALSKMILEVNGMEVKPDYIEYDWGAYPKVDIGWKVVTKIYTFNFPEGMTGEQIFVRRYFFTCQSYLNMGIPVNCKNPAELIEDPDMMNTLAVNFVANP